MNAFPWGFAFRHAARMVWRQRARNAFVLATVTGVCTFSLWMVALFNAKNADLERAILDANTGEVQWLAPAFERARTPFPPASVPDGLAWPVGWRVSRELVSPATIAHTEGSRGVRLVGVFPGEHRLLFPQVDTSALEGENGYGAVIGQSLARQLEVAAGDQVPVYLQGGDGELRSENLRVLAVYHANGTAFEESQIYMAHAGLRALLGLADGGKVPFHRLVAFPGPGEPPAALADFPRRGWRELQPELSAVIDFQEGITRFFLTYMLAVGVLAIAAPISVLWQERLPEMRMLSTVGLPRSALLRMGLLEAVWLYLLAVGCTLVVGGAMAWATSRVGLDLAWMGQESSTRAGIQIPQVIRPLYRPAQFAAMAGFNFVIIFAGYAWNLRKAVGELGEARHGT